MWLSVPDISMERVGEQVGAAWKLVSCTPSLARLAMFGVLISPPKLVMSL